MKQILVLIENELEQSITGDILRSGLGAEAEITLTAGAEQAIQQLQSGAVDLFIADVERFDVAHCNMVTTARKTAPDTPILVTSVGTQEEIAGYVWRLGVRDYLLKPYRPTWLLAAVRALVRKERSGGCAADQQEIYLRRLTEHLQRFQYKSAPMPQENTLICSIKVLIIRVLSARVRSALRREWRKPESRSAGPPSGSCREVWSTFGSALTSRSGNMQPMSLLSGCWTRSLMP